LDEAGIAAWSQPTGGYFVNLEVRPGTATRVVSLAAEAGTALTPARSAFPSVNDPRDSHIRPAPTLPPVHKLRLAVEGLCTCIRLVAAEYLHGNKCAGTVQESASM
jgi:DNA-binding transcriptional MocR family regulator